MKRLISLLLCLILICSLSCTVVSAQSEQISPGYNNMAYTDTGFNIDSNGNATATALMLTYKGA